MGGGLGSGTGGDGDGGVTGAGGDGDAGGTGGTGSEGGGVVAPPVLMLAVSGSPSNRVWCGGSADCNRVSMSCSSQTGFGGKSLSHFFTSFR